ncbi:SDR family NAD(P)-dependent oxidoreductase [Gordonia neofelifaecis]|uniref:Short chain dehydrogenase n=1 Tax=Gordonia neofelifaecis NRRL B-59395 TaxID=644548 RepID=F1YLD1_9ACTN|nr:glucose 1-dehydrogenase [Gordonia neofelifaecis]EGD54591.1 short chain dehydrogenase [Gordonia neofelifaecis NRRL B-59395]
MGRLEDKVAIITGGAKGMGEATARLMAREGAKVVIADVDDARGQALAAEIGDSAEYAHLDVSNESEWQAVVNGAVAKHGRVDALVNNAGILYMAGVADIELDRLNQVLQVNLVGTILGVKTVAPAMTAAGRGSIINISSVDGLRGVNGLSSYVASKWAVRGVTKAQSLELGPHKVRVNSVHPGGVNTELGNPMGETGASLDAHYGAVPLQRIGRPEEVAAVSAFLASDEASYITGAEIAVDGGWSSGVYYAGLPGDPA